VSIAFVQSLKSSWNDLASSPPGKRFQNRYEKKQQDGQSRGRVVKLVAAGLLLAIGIVLLVVPGPGSLVIVLGAALLAEESKRVARGLDEMEVKVRRLFRRN
jgi:putative transmembrane protein PGPGW